MHWRNVKIFSSKTTELISTKLSTKQIWLKEPLIFSNISKGDYNEVVKYINQI